VSGLRLWETVPEHWRVLRNRLVFRERNERDCVELPLVAVSQKHGVMGKRELEAMEGRKLSGENDDLSNYKRVEPGDIVYNKMRMWQGAVGVSGLRGIASPAYVVATPLQGLDSRFAAYLLKSVPKALQPYLNETAASNTQDNLNAEKVKNLPFAFLPLAEQTRIANFLDEQTARIDALIAEKERLVDRLAEYGRSYASDLFSRRIAERGTVKLKHRCSELTVGIVVTPAKYYVDFGVPCLRSLNVSAGRVFGGNLVYISEVANELHAKSKIYAGDIVIVRSGKTGSAAVVTKEFDGANCIDMVVIRASTLVNSGWLCAYLNSDVAGEQVTDASEGAIQQHFNVSSARELLIPDSSQEEQTEDLKALNYVSQATETLKNHVLREIGLFREYRSSLISAAVTGQLDIDNFGREVA
jgi:type I restriction enzyme S subunit